MNKITVITHVWNEKLMLPYFIKHYQKMGVDRIIVYVDRSSKDGSADIAREYGADVLWSPILGLDDEKFVHWANLEYRTYRDQSEWVIWPDCDELVYHKNGLVDCLQIHKEQGHKMVQAGVIWNMMSSKLPTATGQIYDEIKEGVKFGPGKPVIVQPDATLEWVAGKHTAYTKEPIFIDDNLLYLHFRSLGIDYLLERNHSNWNRINERNRQLRHGWHVNPANDKKMIDDFFEQMKRLEKAPL